MISLFSKQTIYTVVISFGHGVVIEFLATAKMMDTVTKAIHRTQSLGKMYILAFNDVDSEFHINAEFVQTIYSYPAIDQDVLEKGESMRFISVSHG